MVEKNLPNFSHFARPIKIFSLLNLGNCCRQGEGGGGNKFRKAKHFWPHYIFLAFQFTSPIFLLHLHLKCATVMFKIFPTSIFLGGGNYPTPSSLISDGHLSTIFRLEWIVSRNFFLTIKDQFEWTLYCNWNQTKLIQLWNIILDVYQAVIRVLLEPDSHMSPTSAMPIVVDHWWVKSFVYVLLHWSQTMASPTSATYENQA